MARSTNGAAVKRSRREPATSRQARKVHTVVRDTELVAQRHGEIVRAATRIFISKGYHGAGVREIAEAAGLSLGGLYTYVKTKEDILYLVFRRISTTLQECVRRDVAGIDDPADRVAAALRATIRTAGQYQDEILLMYQETKSLGRKSLHNVLAEESHYVGLFEDVLQAGYDQGLFIGNPKLGADIVAYLCTIVVLRRWHLGRRFSSEEIENGVIDFILGGLDGRAKR